MNALLVLYAGQLPPEAFEPLAGGKNSVTLTLERARKFPNVAKTVVFGGEGRVAAALAELLPPDVIVESRPRWTVKGLLEGIAAHQEGCDLTFFAWLDCPFVDIEMAGRLADRHLRYAAEYSYADGWPYGLAPELLSSGTAAILAQIIGDDDTAVGRDALFWAIQKDINSFDIETEISTVDLRCHRLNLCADSKRNLLLLRRFIENCDSGAIPDISMVEKIIEEKPELLRTLPNFFPVQVYTGCPQSCAICAYPRIAGTDLSSRKDFMDAPQFETLLDKIIAFSGDAVIDLSLWGELSLHPHKLKLIELVLERPSLALIVETSGIGWKSDELEDAATLARNAAACSARTSPLPPLSWIVSLDTLDAKRYGELRGQGFGEALECAKKLLALFPKDAYVQAVRTIGAEDDIEKFYRSWKESVDARNIIIQKYDDFCGYLPRLQASDISPVKRRPCWHLMRDMPILIDGTVPQCRENLRALYAVLKIETDTGTDTESNNVMGNAFNDTLEKIWEHGYELYTQQCGKAFNKSCAGCDEYYTYNF